MLTSFSPTLGVKTDIAMAGTPLKMLASVRSLGGVLTHGNCAPPALLATENLTVNHSPVELHCHRLLTMHQHKQGL